MKGKWNGEGSSMERSSAGGRAGGLSVLERSSVSAWRGSTCHAGAAQRGCQSAHTLETEKRSDWTEFESEI